MNEFYKGKAGLPRQTRNAKSLRDALEAWRDYRILSVVKACRDVKKDNYRQEFANYHENYANQISEILESPDEIGMQIKMMYSNFESEFTNDLSGPKRDSVGICGAELEKIIALNFK